MDYERAKAVYEVEFYVPATYTEYDYDIDAVTGAVVKWDSDAEGYVPPQTTTTPAATTPAATAAVATTPAATNYITMEKAKAAALAHAGLSAANVTFFRMGMDYERATVVYEVEFYAPATYTEYDYDINAVTGAVVSWDREVEGYAPPQATTPAATPAATTPAPAATTPAPAATTPAPASSLISRTDALNKAIAKAGVSSSSIYDVDVELDWERGVQVYEVSFNAGSREYECDINAATGAILHFHSEYDD
jgi:uncharacterized membrane protein YkoI